jgi:transposase-like protein
MPAKANTTRVKRRKFTPAQKQKYVAEADRTSATAVAKKHKLSSALVYRWKAQLQAVAKSTSVPKAKTKRRRKSRTRSTKLVQFAKTNALETENQRLRNMVVDQLLVIQELQHSA